MLNSGDGHATALWRWCIGSLRRKQVASETVHGARLAMVELRRGCNSCMEENMVCKCGIENGEVGFGSANHAKANSSFAHSVINMVGMLIGLGQLSTPYALENGGWASVFLLVGLGIVCAYTSHIIGKCLEEEPNSKTYQDIGQQAFGTKGRVLASAFIYLEIFLALVSYTISLHDNLALAFPGARIDLQSASLRLSTPQVLTAIAVAVALPSLWLRDLSSISFLSLGGILMSMLIFSTVAWTAVFGGVGSGGGIPVLRMSKIPGISGLYMFSFAGHIVFPNIHRAMKDPSQFTKVSVTSFTLVTILYTSMAFMGAKLFGPSVSSQITLSMPPHRLATKLALWAVVLTPMTKYALEFAPFAAQLEHSLPPSVGSRGRTIVRGTVGSLLLVGILALALSIPYFEHVLGLTGSLISSGISVVIPCVFYLRICWPRVSKRGVLLNGMFIVVGVGFGVVGTLSSFKSLVETMRRSH